MFHILFIVSTGLAYTCGAKISQDLRGKDDQKNHVAAVMSASCVVAAACKYDKFFELAVYAL